MEKTSGFRHASEQLYKVLASISVVHALLILIVWLFTFYGDTILVSAMAWVLAAWLWLVWPFVLYFFPGKSLNFFIGALVIGVMLLLPCITTIHMFTVWGLEGFAP